MLPLGMPIPVAAAVTPEMQGKLTCVKWCIILTYICAVGRFMTLDHFGAINDLFAALFGTFLLPEDRHLSYCYRALSDSPLGNVSDGGLSCIVPYMAFAALNGIFSSFRVYATGQHYGTIFPCSAEPGCYLPVFLCASAAAQLLSFALCYKVWKLMTSAVSRTPLDELGAGLNVAGHLEMERQLDRAGRGGPAEARRGLDGRRTSSDASPMVPFQGRPHRLVEEEPSASNAVFAGAAE